MWAPKGAQKVLKGCWRCPRAPFVCLLLSVVRALSVRVCLTASGMARSMFARVPGCFFFLFSVSAAFVSPVKNDRPRAKPNKAVLTAGGLYAGFWMKNFVPPFPGSFDALSTPEQSAIVPRPAFSGFRAENRSARSPPHLLARGPRTPIDDAMTIGYRLSSDFGCHVTLDLSVGI